MTPKPQDFRVAGWGLGFRDVEDLGLRVLGCFLDLGRVWGFGCLGFRVWIGVLGVLDEGAKEGLQLTGSVDLLFLWHREVECLDSWID